MSDLIPYLYGAATLLGVLTSFWAQSRLAHIALRWGLGLYVVGIAIIAALEWHCGPSLFKGLGACPAGPWLNDLARTFELPLLFVLFSSAFVIPALILVAVVSEALTRRAP